MENNNNNKEQLKKNFNEKETKIEEITIPTNKPITRKASFFSESKKNKRSEKKIKNNPQQQKEIQQNNKQQPQSIRSKNQNNKNNFITSNNNSRVGSSKSSKNANSKVNSLNSSFSSVENFSSKNNLGRKTSSFQSNLTNINEHHSRNNSKRSNFKKSCSDSEYNTNNIANKHAKAVTFINNIKKTKIYENKNTKKFSQQVAKKLNKDTKIMAYKLKSNQNKLNSDPDEKGRFLKEFLSRNLLNMEVDACQQQINELMIEFTEISHACLNAKAERESEIEFYGEKNNEILKEIEILEDELRKNKANLALIEQDEMEAEQKHNLMKIKLNNLDKLESTIDEDINLYDKQAYLNELTLISQLEIQIKKEADSHKFYEELVEIRKNMAVLKPFFKKFIVIRGLDKRNFSEKKQFSNDCIIINEDENNLKIIIPKCISCEKNLNNNSNNNSLFENYTIFYDEVFTLYQNELWLMDRIIKDNHFDAILNRDVTNILSSYFNKSLNYNDKDKKDYFCLYVSDQIKLSLNESLIDKNINSQLNNKANSIISFNKNFIISLEKVIKEFLPLSAYDFSCFLITKDDFIPFSSSKNIDIKDLKKFDFNVIKYDSIKALNNLEKNISLDLFSDSSNKEEIKSLLITDNDIELANFNCENYFFAENFINLLTKFNSNLFGIYVKITCLKNHSELKFIYSDINQAKVNNEIIKKLNEISNKNTRKAKTTKKADLSKEENKLVDLITEKIDFTNVKHFSCIMDISYDFNLETDEYIVSDFNNNNNNNNKNDKNNCENSNKEYASLAYDKNKSELNDKSINNNIRKKKGSDNLSYKNPLSRSNSFNKGTNSSQNVLNNSNNTNIKNVIKDNSNNKGNETGSNLKKDHSVGKINNISSRISPNTLRKNSNINSNIINNDPLKSMSKNILNKSRNNSVNKNNFASNNNKNDKENSVAIGKINNQLNNIKNFDKNFLSVDSDKEIIGLKIKNEEKSKFESLIDIELLSIKESNGQLKEKNEENILIDNLDSFGKNIDNAITNKENEENSNEISQSHKFNFNFDYTKFEEIVKFFKEK